MKVETIMGSLAVSKELLDNTGYGLERALVNELCDGLPAAPDGYAWSTTISWDRKDTDVVFSAEHTLIPFPVVDPDAYEEIEYFNYAEDLFTLSNRPPSGDC